MIIDEHTNTRDLLINVPECREFLYPYHSAPGVDSNLHELAVSCNISLNALRNGIERYVKRAKQNPHDYHQMREQLVKPGTVNIAGFVNFLWQEPFVKELEAKAEKQGFRLNINIFPKHAKKQFQNYLATCNNPGDLPEILIGKGFSSFMTSYFVNTFVKQGYYQHPMPGDGMSDFFKSKSFADPHQSYHPFGVEELVMVYDSSRSHEVPPPHSWEDILQPGYHGMLSQMGKEQKDHFGFIMMLYLYNSLGEEGIKRYAANVKIKQHFTRTIKNMGKRNDQSAPVNIMHQFAAKFTRSDIREKIQVIDTQEGNPSACHFFLMKNRVSEQTVEMAKHLYSEPIKNIIEKAGTTHISSPSPLSGSKNTRWIGWDTLRELPLPYLKEHLSEIAYKYFKQ